MLKKQKEAKNMRQEKEDVRRENKGVSSALQNLWIIIIVFMLDLATGVILDE